MLLRLLLLNKKKTITVEENKLLEDEQFLRIQNLTSIDCNERRIFIIYDKHVPESDDTSNDIEQDSLGVDSFVDDGNCTIKQIVTSSDKDKSSVSILKDHLFCLLQMEKGRYCKRQDSAIFFFSGVDFDTRQTLLDATTAEHLITSSNGPILERQINAVEKSTKKVKKQ